MKKQTTRLSVDISLDSAGFVEITSRDRKLKGRPFKIKLGSDTSTYQSLVSLAKEEGLELTPVSLPSTAEVTTVGDLIPSGMLTRSSLGIGADGNSVEIDIEANSTTLIAGKVNSGRSNVLRNITAIAAGVGSKILGIAPDRTQISDLLPDGTLGAVISGSPDSDQGLVNFILEEIRIRSKLNFAELAHEKRIFFIVEELDRIDPNLAIEIMAIVNKLSLYKRDLRVYVFATTHIENARKFALSFSQKIATSEGRSSDNANLFGESAEYPSTFFATRGNAVLKTRYGKQTPFIQFHLVDKQEDAK